MRHTESCKSVNAIISAENTRKQETTDGYLPTAQETQHVLVDHQRDGRRDNTTQERDRRASIQPPKPTVFQQLLSRLPESCAVAARSLDNRLDRVHRQSVCETSAGSAENQVNMPSCAWQENDIATYMPKRRRRPLNPPPGC